MLFLAPLPGPMQSDSSTESEGDIEMLDSLEDVDESDKCAVNKFKDYDVYV